MYNVPQSVDLAGPLDRDALAWALARIAARHESLRTTFESVDADVCQRVHEVLPFAFAEDDLSAQADDAVAQAARLDTVLAADLAAPFDLARGPLWRVRLVRLAADRHVLSIVMHLSLIHI